MKHKRTKRVALPSKAATPEGYSVLLREEADAPHDGRADLENRYGQVWSTDELQRDFDVTGFLAPFVVVRRRSDDAKGSLMQGLGKQHGLHNRFWR